MKKWLQERFLPMWAKETVLQENRSLRQENERLFNRVRQLEAYIRGLHRGSRYPLRGVDSPQRNIKHQGGKQWTS